MVIRDNAIREFVARPDIKNKPLWLLTYPEDGFFPGMAHAIWYYSSRAQPDSHESLIMTDSFTWLSDIKSMGFYGFVSDHGWFHCAPYTTKNDYVVTRYRNTIRLTSLDTKKWGFSSPYKKLNTPLGRKTIHRTTSIKNGHKVNSDISIEIDDQWISRDPAFVIWDFEQQKFCLIKPTE
jgi:hypothetical protein